MPDSYPNHHRCQQASIWLYAWIACSFVLESCLICLFIRELVTYYTWCLTWYLDYSELLLRALKAIEMDSVYLPYDYGQGTLGQVQACVVIMISRRSCHESSINLLLNSLQWLLFDPTMSPARYYLPYQYLLYRHATSKSKLFAHITRLLVWELVL